MNVCLVSDHKIIEITDRIVHIRTLYRCDYSLHLFFVESCSHRNDIGHSGTKKLKCNALCLNDAEVVLVHDASLYNSDFL